MLIQTTKVIILTPKAIFTPCTCVTVLNDLSSKHVLTLLTIAITTALLCWSVTNLSASLSLQAVLVYEILNYVDDPEKSTVSHGVGLSFALFSSEFFKAFLISLLWALNLRTAVRLKGAFSAVAFQKVISLRVHSGISMGEVKTVVSTDFMSFLHFFFDEVWLTIKSTFDRHLYSSISKWS